MNAATNPSAGCATSSCGAANWRSFALDDHADLVGERRRVLVVVRHEQRRQPELAEQLLQLAADRDLRVRVERGERLVEEQHAGVARKRTRERDPLALAAGELGRPGLRQMRDLEAVEVLVDALPPAVGDVLAHVHVREERVLLEHEPDPALVGLESNPGRRVEPHLVAERDPPARRAHEPGDGPEHRRLAGAGRPDERDRPLDLEREL